VAPDPSYRAFKTEELAELLRAIRERVSARYPDASNGAAPMTVTDLMPLVQARDAAEAKVAAIGTVNPRPRGPLNSLVQLAKRAVSRGLNWFVRDQVVFNRELMACVEATLEAFNEMNRAIASAAERARAIGPIADELKDMRTHWIAWRAEWEQKLATNEIQFLRSVADLQGAFQHRNTLMESNFREMVRAQHTDYLGALERSTLDIQKKLWADLDHIRTEYEALIHSELRVVRQRAGALAQTVAPPPVPPTPEAGLAFDYGRFAERFRGPEEYVKSGQSLYVPYFSGCKEVLDIGCGRGEFLGLMREAGIPARGIDLSRESVDLCRSRGLQAMRADERQPAFR
jgi:O-antigen chain-terminating methyltransferase